VETADTETCHTFKPNIKRFLLITAGLPIAARLLGFSARFLLDYFSKGIMDFRWQASDLLIDVSIGTFFAILWVWNIDHYYITMTPSTISGPSSDGLFGETTFSLDRLDIDSINQITFWDKLGMHRKILSKDKGKIFISRLVYSKAQEDEIIATLLSSAQNQPVVWHRSHDKDYLTTAI